LSKQDNPLWDLYYRSNIYPIAFKAMDIINSLNELVYTFINYKTNSITFNKKILDTYKNYILYLNNHNCDDIKHILYDLLKFEFDKYFTMVKNLSTNYNEDISCLPYIFQVLNENLISNINLEELNSLETYDEKL
jgi:hypothetical protein